MVEIHPVLKQRRSGVAFSGEPPEAEKLAAMLEAFRWAPSSRNAQPWRIVVVRSPEAHQKFDEGLSANNQKWATQAPVKMIILGNPEEQPDRNGQSRWLLDIGLALENMLLQGCDLGLTVHAMAGWDENTILKNFHIPAPFRVAALFAVGYPGKVADLSDEMQQKASQPFASHSRRLFSGIRSGMRAKLRCCARRCYPLSLLFVSPLRSCCSLALHVLALQHRVAVYKQTVHGRIHTWRG